MISVNRFYLWSIVVLPIFLILSSLTMAFSGLYMSIYYIPLEGINPSTVKIGKHIEVQTHIVGAVIMVISFVYFLSSQVLLLRLVPVIEKVLSMKNAEYLGKSHDSSEDSGLVQYLKKKDN